MTVVLTTEDLAVVRCRSRARAAWYALGDTVAEFAPRRTSALSLRHDETYVLKGIDLKLHAGEALGVIGENGAGKSTLLKVLAGLLAPSSGRVARHGRVEAVIELGAGLNPLLSGRENVQLVAALRELRPDEARDHLEAVDTFADLGAAFDASVASYSSGMTARLAFAIAAMAGPDVLLVDEALSVGDLAFQRKCTRFIQGFLEGGGALVLASHNLMQVQLLCSQAILLGGGTTLFAGKAVDAVRAMVERVPPDIEPTDTPASVRLVHFGSKAGPATTGAAVDVTVEYWLDRELDDISWGFELWTADEQQCVTTAQDLKPRVLSAGRGTLQCRIERLPIAPGSYSLKLNLIDLGSGVAVALAGFGGPAVRVTIESPPSIESNYQVESGQLAVVEVNWS